MTQDAAKQKKLVACVGNMLMLDEGFGPYMAKVLTERDAALEQFDEEHADLLMKTFRPAETEEPEDDDRIPVLDAGTMGLSLLPFIRDYDLIVVVDIVNCGPDAVPGTCYTFTPEEMAANCVMHSLHDMRIPDVLTNARLAGYDADIRCVGVQKKDCFPKDLTIDLTDEVKASVPMATGAILELLELDI